MVWETVPGRGVLHDDGRGRSERMAAEIGAGDGFLRAQFSIRRDGSGSRQTRLRLYTDDDMMSWKKSILLNPVGYNVST